METGRICRVHTERPRIFFLLTVLTAETKIHDKNVHNIMLHFHLPVLASLMRCLKLSQIMTELYQNIGGYSCGIFFFFIVFVVHLIKEKNWSMNWMFGPKVEVYRVNLDNCYTPVCEVGHINWSTTRYYLPWDKVQYVMVCNCIWRPHKHWGQ